MNRPEPSNERHNSPGDVISVLFTLLNGKCVDGFDFESNTRLLWTVQGKIQNKIIITKIYHPEKVTIELRNIVFQVFY